MMKKVLAMMLLGLVALTAKAQTSDFVRGADVSWCMEMEADGCKYYNADGTETEMMALMKEIGMTAIRLRVWVNPQKYGYGAWCDKADVLAKAKRAKAAGLDLMIDFHYSDFFADPSRQETPLDWAGYTLDQLKTAVANHTKDVLKALKDEGIEPKWVQVGNETNNGMLDPLGKIDWNSKSGSARYTDYVAVSNAGYDAVKEVLPNAYVIVHLGVTDGADWFFKEFKAAGGKFDMIGLSHYPTETDWNSTASTKYSNISLANMVKQVAENCSVPVMICETGFDVNKPALASSVMKDLFKRMQEIPACAGIFYWEPEVDGQWKPAYYSKMSWGAYGKGAFSTTGRPTAILDAFSGKTSEETGTYPSKLKIYNKDGNAVLATLPQTSEGIYTGQFNATDKWHNFLVVDEEHGIWYGTDPSDKTALSSAAGHWNFWIDSEQTGIYDIEVNLVTMKWTHTYNAEATAGISTFLTDTEAPAIWYDLQGRRLSTPAKGLRIKKSGGRIEKVICQ